MEALATIGRGAVDFDWVFFTPAFQCFPEVHEYVFESTVFLLPTTVHFLPAVSTPCAVGTTDVERTINMTAASKRLIISLLL